MPSTSEDEPEELSFESLGAHCCNPDLLSAVQSLHEQVTQKKELATDALESIIVPVFVDLRTSAISQLVWHFPKGIEDYRPLHALNACRLSMHFAQHSGLDDSKVVQLGSVALLYDVGMWSTELPPVLEPKAMTQEEMVQIEAHVEGGASLLEGIAGIDPLCVRVAREHHERADGTGYPGRLGTDQQHPYSRLLQIIDSFLGMIEPRSFRKPVSPVEAMQRLAVQAHRGYYHLPTFRDWLKVMGVYPVGTFVTLNTGELAIIEASGGDSLKRPKVFVLADELLDFRLNPMELDLTQESAFEIDAAFTKFPK